MLAESRGEWGYMWECPDFYQLDDKYVLTFSPMGESDRKAVYLVGDFDYDTGKFSWQVSGEIDWGMDYYAPQSFLAPDGRTGHRRLGERVAVDVFLEGLGADLPGRLVRILQSPERSAAYAGSYPSVPPG